MTPDEPEQVIPQPKLPNSRPDAPVFGATAPGKKPKAKGVQATFLPNMPPSAANAGIGLKGL